MAYNPYYQPNYYNPMGNMPDFSNPYKGYQQQQTQPMQAQPLQNPVTQPTQSDILWVMGEAGAKAYPVAPNNTVTLWDRDSQTIYIKSCDASGIPSMRVLDWTDRNPTQKQAQNQDENQDIKFVSIEQFEELKGNFESLNGNFESLTKEFKKLKETKAKPATKKEENENG